MESNWSCADLLVQESEQHNNEGGTFVMHPVNAMLLNFSIELQRKHIHNEHTVVGFLLVE